MSRLDGSTDLSGLSKLTGLPLGQVETMVGELVALGAVIPETTGSLFSDLSILPPSQPSEREAAAVTEEPPEDDSPSGDSDETGEPGVPGEAAPIAARAESATHRKLFEQTLHHLSTDERIALARLAEEPELSAFCFDPVPQVIGAVFDNSKAGLTHARLVAAHHHSPAGLEIVASRAPFAAEPGVRRALLQNPLLPSSIFRRLWSPRRLLEQFLVTSSHDVPEQTRHAAREVLRTSFVQRPGDERVELILKTEGRCLASLIGLTIDGKTTSLLCRRTYVSTLLIQNIARWSAAPPQLIAHLQRQDAVRRNLQLRQLLERHPNAS